MQKIQDLIADELSRQKSRLFLWVPLCFSIGIGLYFSLKTEPSFVWNAGISVLTIGLTLFLSRYQDKTIHLKALFIAMIGISLACVGFTASQIRTQLVYTPMIVKKITPVDMEGTIESIEALEEGSGSRLILKDVVVERLVPDQTPRKIRLTVRKDEGLKAGQRVKMLAGLNPPSPPVAPGAFDFQRMAFFQGIGAMGFAYTAPEILADTTHGKSLAKLRQNIGVKIQQHTQEPQASILIALMNGYRGAISEEDKDSLRASGLAHLLAISGLHVGMVAGVLFFFSRLFFACFPPLAIHYPIKKWAAVVALIGALFYTLVVGATIPTQRALIMTGLVMVAVLCDRSPFSLRLVALAAFVVLLFSPESLTGVSFQMSFAAVVALICFYEYIRPVWIALHRKAGIMRRVALYFTGVLLTTLIAGTATGLFSLYHFQQYALYGMLANMIAVPLMAFVVMPLIVVAYVLMPIGLEGLTLSMAEWGVGWIMATSHWVSAMEGAVWHVPSWPQWIFILMVLGLWIMMIWQGRLQRLMVPVLIILVGLVYFYKQPDILVSSKVDLVAVRDKDGLLWMSNGRKERFTAENWLRRNGELAADKKIWPREGAVENFPLDCDPAGCRGEIEGQRVAIAFSNKAWLEDCKWADLVISQTPVSGGKCQAGQVIDYFDVWREGPHAIWLSAKQIKIQTVEEVRGNRPWTQTAANRKEAEKKDRKDPAIKSQNDKF